MPNKCGFTHLPRTNNNNHFIGSNLFFKKRGYYSLYHNFCGLYSTKVRYFVDYDPRIDLRYVNVLTCVKLIFFSFIKELWWFIMEMKWHKKNSCRFYAATAYCLDRSETGA